MDSSSPACSVCDEAGSTVSAYMSCDHAFCSSCFSRFLHGSIDELNRSVRCCICGGITLLTYESKGETLMYRFGRDSEPKIKYATGLTRTYNGDYVMLDPTAHRVYVLDQSSNVVNDFAYLYKYDVKHGLTVDNTDRIIFPITTVGGTDPFNPPNHTGLAYYCKGGSFIGITYLDPDSDVQGLATTPDNKIIVTDASNSKLWFIHERQRVISTKVLECEIGETEDPQPWGITVDKENTIYVTDTANHCVKVLDKNGQLKFKFGSQGDRPGQFNCPTGIAVDESGRIIVADKYNNRVQMFNDEGMFERFIVRYNTGKDVYMVPVDVECIKNGQVAVLLRGEKEAKVSEVRIYPCEGHPDILSC